MDSRPLLEMVRQRLGDNMDEYFIPPPVFEAMEGEFLAFDKDSGTLTTRFPVLDKHLNPYGTMQGGMVAAAVDNTLGPLSMLIARPNVTRRLHMKYNRPVTPDLEQIVVLGRLTARKGRRLFFSAEVRDQNGLLLARARADHWILDDSSA